MQFFHIVGLSLGVCLLSPASAQPTGNAPSTLRVLSAEAGLFGAPESGARHFVPSRHLPLKDGQVFGWKMTLQTSKTKVLVREELVLPAEPMTWGDPEPDIKRKTSADGKTSTTEIWLAPKDGMIFRNWTVTQGDPKGVWTLRISIDGQSERVFRLDAR